MGNKKVQAHKETEIKIIPYYKNLNATKNPIKNKKKLSMGVSKIKTFYQDPAILMALFNQIMKEQNYHHLVIFNPDRLDVHTIMMKDPAISAKEALELALKNSNEWADKVKKLLGECGFVEQKLDYNPNQVENKEKQSLSYTIVNCNDFIKNQYFDKILEITRNFYQQGRIEKDITSNANIFSRSVLMAAKQFAASLESVDQTKDNIEKRIEFHGREYIITELAYMYLFNSVLGCEDTAYPVSDDKKKISKKVFDAFKLLEKEINSHNIGITSNLRLYDIKLEHIKEKNKNSTPPEKFTVNNEQKTSNNKLQKVLIPPQNGQSSVSQVPVKPTMPASRTQIKKRIAVLERKIYRLLERR
jgi:hypothetical protein